MWSLGIEAIAAGSTEDVGKQNHAQHTGYATSDEQGFEKPQGFQSRV